MKDEADPPIDHNFNLMQVVDRDLENYIRCSMVIQWSRYSLVETNMQRQSAAAMPTGHCDTISNGISVSQKRICICLLYSRSVLIKSAIWCIGTIT